MDPSALQRLDEDAAQGDAPPGLAVAGAGPASALAAEVEAAIAASLAQAVGIPAFGSAAASAAAARAASAPASAENAAAAAPEATNDAGPKGAGEAKQEPAKPIPEPIVEALRLEQSYLRVPVEEIKRSMRMGSRLVEKDLQSVLACINDLNSPSSGAAGTGGKAGARGRRGAAAKVAAVDAASAPGEPGGAAVSVAQLEALVARLQGLKRKLQEHVQAEGACIQRCRSRLDRIAALVAAGQAAEHESSPSPPPKDGAANPEPGSPGDGSRPMDVDAADAERDAEMGETSGRYTGAPAAFPGGRTGAGSLGGGATGPLGSVGGAEGGTIGMEEAGEGSRQAEGGAGGGGDVAMRTGEAEGREGADGNVDGSAKTDGGAEVAGLSGSGGAGAGAQGTGKGGPSSLEAAIKEWNEFRVNRLIVDYMLNCSHFESAKLMASRLGIEDHVDIDLFVRAHKVTSALQRHECGPALAWCSEQRPKLKKLKSELEFRVRVQEFVELVRAERLTDAVAYARKHLAPHAPTHLKELQRAMAALAFRSQTQCQAYKELFEESQWAKLAELFHRDLAAVYGVTRPSAFLILLQAGLSVLKTPFGYEENCTRQDPLSYPSFRRLAEPLPFSKRVHSQLVCYITKELMDDHNPPLVLPNGYAYSRKAMEDMARRSNGRITCPRSGETYSFNQLVKAYIF